MTLLSSRSLRAAALVAALSLAACDRQSEPPEQAADGEDAVSNAETSVKNPFTGTLDIANRGKEMPELAIALPDGSSKSLSDFKGKPLLLNLWATWCGPCVVEMPTLDALAAKHDGNLKVLTVSQDLGGAEQVMPYFTEADFAHLEPWLDPENDLGFAYGTGVLPTTVLYDAEGKEVWRMIGGHEWSGARTEAMLADVLDTGDQAAK